MKPYDIYVTLCFPPDTETAGYAQENLNKPQETHMISETGGLYQPEYVAKCLVQDAVNGKFLSSIGLVGFMISTLTCGFASVNFIMEGLFQVGVILKNPSSLKVQSHYD